jgi:hypothetical protein
MNILSLTLGIFGSGRFDIGNTISMVILLPIATLACRVIFGMLGCPFQTTVRMRR